MQFGYLGGDRQPESAAFGIGPQNAVKALENARALFDRDADTVVFHLDHREATGTAAHRDVATRCGVLDRVVHQVVKQFAQQQGHAVNPQGAAAFLETEIDPLRQRTHDRFFGHTARQCVEVE